MLNCFLLLEEPLALSLRERWGHGLRRGRQAVAWPSRISGLPGEHDRMMGKAPISTGLRRQAAGGIHFLLFSRGCGLYLRAPGFDKTISSSQSVTIAIL